MIRAVIVALMLLLGMLSASAQQPPRDNASAASTRVGAASVSGIVTLGDEASTPVRRAVVSMLSSDGVETRSAVSDDEGRFAIGGLSAGRYTLQAFKPAHLTMAYGARRPGRLGTSLVLTDRQSIRDLRLPLPRGAVLAGRLALENGEPLANTRLFAIPRRLATAGGVANAPLHDFLTDDRGEFRIYGLLPDTYLLAALPTFGGEIERRSDSDFDAIVRALQQPATAQSPRTGRTAASRSEPFPVPERVGYAPTYFPGTPVVSDATPIVVLAGEVRDGLDFTISRLPLATISGMVIGVDGQPKQAARVSIEPEGPAWLPLDINLAALLRPLVANPNTRGEFSITGVPPGRYHVRAHAAGTITRDGATLAQTEWALADVAVSGRDLNGLTLTLQVGRVFSGTLFTDPTAAPASSTSTAQPTSAAKPPLLSGAVVILQPTKGSASLVLNGLMGTNAVRQAPVGADGRFTVTGLVPSDYEVRVTLPPALSGGGWKVGSIRQRGRDLRDAPLTFADGSIDGVEIVLSTAVTELAGRLTSE